MRLDEQPDVEVAENLTFALGWVAPDYPWNEKLPVKAVTRYLCVSDKPENFFRVKQDILNNVQIIDIVLSRTWWKELVDKARPADLKNSPGFLE